MNFFKNFNPFQTKSHTLLSWLIGNNTPASYNNNEMLNAYIKACPIFTATSWIVDACNDIDFVIKDIKKDEFIYDHPILKLLKNPNPFTNSDEFKKSIFNYFLLTGNVYLIKTKSLKKEILELYNISPLDVSIFANANDNYANQYNITNLQQAVFNRTGNYTFVASNGNELIHHKNPNPLQNRSDLFGLSFFAGCQLEIKKYIEASIHNLSLIKNGGRPSGLLSYKGDKNLPQNIQQDIKKSIDEKLKGGANAGNIITLNDNFEYKPLGESIRDMDYKGLQDAIEKKIYQAVKIPNALFDSSTMTYSNLDVSQYAFYDRAVLPIFKSVCKFLNERLLKDFKDSENLEITFDKSLIPALETREITNARDLHKESIISKNEARAKIGYEAINGGDQFYQPSSLVPIGFDSNINSNRESPAKSELRRLMLKNGYSKDEIELTIKSYES